MFTLFNNLRQALCACRRGSVVMETALVVPMMLALLAGTVEIGRAYYQANAVEKGVRAAAVFAARQPLPISATAVMQAENLAKTGTLDGSGALLVSSWNAPGAHFTLGLGSFALDEDRVIPVIEIEAAVPFDSILPGLASFAKLPQFTIKTRQEQAYLGS